MKLKIGLLVTALTLGVFNVSTANAGGCYGMSRSQLGPVVAPFCDHSQRMQRPQRQQYRGQGNGCGQRGCGGGQQYAPPHVEYIPQEQPPGGRRCVVNGVPGWCVN